MVESYRKRMVNRVRSELKITRDLLALQKQIIELEKTPSEKRYLGLKETLNIFSQTRVGRDEKLEEEKAYVFDEGCSCQNCLFTGYNIGFKEWQKMIMANFYCLDCGSVISIPLSEVDQFRSEHNVINTNAIDHENYEADTISVLRDYYFRLLMNNKAEEALRIFTLTYEEILEARKINSDSVSR